jgi:hypothetical protein
MSSADDSMLLAVRAFRTGSLSFAVVSCGVNGIDVIEGVCVHACAGMIGATVREKTGSGCTGAIGATAREKTGSGCTGAIGATVLVATVSGSTVADTIGG